MSAPSGTLADWLRRLPDSAPALSFFERALEAGQPPGSLAFRAAYASVARRLGPAGSLPPASPPAVEGLRPPLTLTDLWRAALLGRALGSAPAAEHAALVQGLFEGGEIGEQESLLRTLMLLPEPERYRDTALLGCRTNARRVFEAIACENAFPPRFFAEPEYNQMVLKAVFLEVPVARIEGLGERRTSELLRMVRSYESERRAAGRPVPADVAFILGTPS